MKIDANTKVIGRFHREASPRGLNIYNPYFQENKINAIYVLFHNQDPKVLIDGFRSLNLTGAITAGFESDMVLPTLLDDIDESAKFIGKIGYITNDNGKLIGHTQGGLGMFRTVTSIVDLNNKDLVIVGAGNIARGFLFEIEKAEINCNITIYNKTLSKAEELAKRFSNIHQVSAFEELTSARGDIFVNLTRIGGSVNDYSFPEKVVGRFSHVVDVTFETELTPLVSTAKKLGKKVATGWDMFTYQGQVCLEGLLGIKVDPVVFKKYVSAGLSEVVK